MAGFKLSVEGLRLGCAMSLCASGPSDRSYVITSHHITWSDKTIFTDEVIAHLAQWPCLQHIRLPACTEQQLSMLAASPSVVRIVWPECRDKSVPPMMWQVPEQQVQLMQQLQAQYKYKELTVTRW